MASTGGNEKRDRGLTPVTGKRGRKIGVKAQVRGHMKIIGLVDKALTCGFRKRGSPRFWARKWPNCASELDIRGSAEYYSVCFAKEWAVSLLAIVKKEVSIRGKDLESGRSQEMGTNCTTART